MSKSDYLENAMLGHALCKVPFTMPTDHYVGLMTQAATEAAPQGEVTGNGYARKQVVFTSPPTAGQTSNNADVTFDVATPNGWGTIVAFAVFDAATGGNMLYHGTLQQSRTVQANDQVKFPAGSLQVSED